MTLKIKTKAIIGIIVGLVAYIIIAIVTQFWVARNVSEVQSIDTLKMFSQSAFQTLRATMNLGSVELVEAAVHNAKEIEGVHNLKIYKSKEIIELFEVPEEFTTNPDILYVFDTKEETILEYNDGEDHLARILKPFIAQEECMACHTNATLGQVLGVMDLEISLNKSDSVITSTVSGTALFIIIISVIFGFLIMWQVYRVLLNPLSKLKDTVVEVEKTKDLTQRIDVAADDEVGQTVNAFNNLMESISQILKEINEKSFTLSSASEELSVTTTEIKKAAEEVNQGVDKTAESSSRSASDIREVAHTFKEISDSVQGVRSMADEAEVVAKQGTQAVEATNEAIVKIAESSKKIVGIMDVISEISNQTNLLSLNAAIEAAKAGEFGKGFAVVADEVRNLAERSSSSSEEIRKLIEISSSNVKDGAEVVDQTGKVLFNIIEQVSKISQSIQDVAEKRTAQDHQISEIAHANEGISEISQSNAVAMNELSQTITQVDSTTEDLTKMAEDLKALVDSFKV